MNPASIRREHEMRVTAGMRWFDGPLAARKKELDFKPVHTLLATFLDRLDRDGNLSDEKHAQARECRRKFGQVGHLIGVILVEHETIMPGVLPWIVANFMADQAGSEDQRALVVGALEERVGPSIDFLERESGYTGLLFRHLTHVEAFYYFADRALGYTKGLPGLGGLAKTQAWRNILFARNKLVEHPEELFNLGQDAFTQSLRLDLNGGIGLRPGVVIPNAGNWEDPGILLTAKLLKDALVQKLGARLRPM